MPPLPLQNHIPPKSSSNTLLERPPLRTLSESEWEILSECATSLGNKFDKIRNGEPLANHGARQSTMFKIASVIIGRLKLNSPDIVYQALAPSVAAALGKGSKVTLENLWDRCCYLVDIDKAKRAAQEEIQNQVRSNQPPIVYHNNSFYIFATESETYRQPVPGAALCQALEQWCKIPGLETRNPQRKPRTVPEYLADYGRQAVEVVVEMGREKSVYHADLNGGTLIDGCCVPARISPKKMMTLRRGLKNSPERTTKNYLIGSQPSRNSAGQHAPFTSRAPPPVAKVFFVPVLLPFGHPGLHRLPTPRGNGIAP